MPDIAANRAKRIINIKVRSLQGIGERRRIGAIQPGAIIGDFTGARCVSHQDLPTSRLSVCQPLMQTLEIGSRIVSACIKNEELQPDGVVLDDIDEVVEHDCIGNDPLRGAGIDVHRQ